jgi:hypothetical protein
VLKSTCLIGYLSTEVCKLHKEILKCIQELEAAGQEATVSQIKQRTDFDESVIQQVLDNRSQNKNDDLETLLVSHTTSEVQNAILDQPMPLLIEATMFQMQKNFSDMGNSLWNSVAQSAQQAVDLEKQKYTQKVSEITQAHHQVRAQLFEANQQLKDTQQNLQALNGSALESEKTNLRLAAELEASQQANSALTTRLEQLTQRIDNRDNESEVNRQELQRLNKQGLMSQKVADRTAKEKTFITQELKSLQKELFLSDTIINDLFTENIIDSQFLENYSYDKHKRIIDKNSLTKKVFDK